MESRTKMRAEIIRLGTSLDRYCVVSACGLINGHIQPTNQQFLGTNACGFARVSALPEAKAAGAS